MPEAAGRGPRPGRGRTIVDSGPLIAFLVVDDAHHGWARERFERLSGPFLTCEPVLTETFHLLRRVPGGAERMFDLLGRGLLEVPFDAMRELRSLRKLMLKYSDLPMSFADACLVRMAEIHKGAKVFSVDGQFRIYRKHGRQAIPAILPPVE